MANTASEMISEDSYAEIATFERELIITRILNAPRHLVWKVWTEQEHLVRWCGPRDFTILPDYTDFRLGGRWRTCLRSPAGKDYWAQGVYCEITEPGHLVFTHAWEDENGHLGHETRVTITLEAQAEKTKLTFRQAMFQSTAARDSHQEGWSETFDRLEQYLAEVS